MLEGGYEIADASDRPLERGVDEDLAGLRIERRHARDEHHVAGAGAGGHRRAPLLEIAVNRLDPDVLSFHASVPGPCVANLRSLPPPGQLSEGEADGSI